MAWTPGRWGEAEENRRETLSRHRRYRDAGLLCVLCEPFAAFASKAFEREDREEER